MLRIITDFDGPIMDVSERYYRVYQFCLNKISRPGQIIHWLSKSEFWELKRSCVPEVQIGKISGLDDDQAQAFSDLRRRTVHNVSQLGHDQPVPGAIATLDRIQQSEVDLVVMTMRRVRELNCAFEQYGLEKFFARDRRYCLTNDYLKTKDTQDKPILMKRALAELPAATETWMIGDTDADIIAAQTYNIPAIGVLSGIRNRTQLESYQPNFIVKDFSAALDFILQRSSFSKAAKAAATKGANYVELPRSA